MPIPPKILGEAFDSAVGLVESLVTTGKEKAEAVQSMLELKTRTVSEVIEYRMELVKAKGAVILAEAQSQHKLTSMWRPITMLTFLAIIVWAKVLQHLVRAIPGLDAIPETEIDPEMWELLKLGLGGYVIGRSVEKVADKVISQERLMPWESRADAKAEKRRDRHVARLMKKKNRTEDETKMLNELLGITT